MGNKARKVRWGQLLDGLDWYVYSDLVPCPNSVVRKNKHFLCHCFCESLIREQLQGLVLAQVLLWHCSHDVSWGWSRLKARPGLEDLFPRWRTQVPSKLVPAVGGRPHSSTHGPTHKATWESSQHSVWLPTKSVIQEAAWVRSHNVIDDPALEVAAIISVICSRLYGSALSTWKRYSRGAHRGVWLPKGRDPWRPPWRLAGWH